MLKLHKNKNRIHINLPSELFLKLFLLLIIFFRNKKNEISNFFFFTLFNYIILFLINNILLSLNMAASTSTPKRELNFLVSIYIILCFFQKANTHIFQQFNSSSFFRAVVFLVLMFCVQFIRKQMQILRSIVIYIYIYIHTV